MTQSRTVAALVAAIEPLDDVEADHRVRALDWIHSGQGLYRTRAPDEPSPHLVSYFPVVDPAARSVLLVHHRKADLWLPPGGHVEPDEDPHRTVEREAVEELGQAARFRWDHPRFLTMTATRGPGSHVDVSLWYVLTGHPDDPLTPDLAEFREVRWFDLDRTDWSDGFDPHQTRFATKLTALL